MQQSDGLFWHTMPSKAYWGRANGWVAGGMTELLVDLPPGPRAIRSWRASGAGRPAHQAGHRRRRRGLLAPGARRKHRERGELVHGDVHVRAHRRPQERLVLRCELLTAADGWLAVGQQDQRSGQLDNVCPGTGPAPPGRSRRSSSSTRRSRSAPTIRTARRRCSGRRSRCFATTVRACAEQHLARISHQAWFVDEVPRALRRPRESRYAAVRLKSRTQNDRCPLQRRASCTRRYSSAVGRGSGQSSASRGREPNRDHGTRNTSVHVSKGTASGYRRRVAAPVVSGDVFACRRRGATACTRRSPSRCRASRTGASCRRSRRCSCCWPRRCCT